MPTDLRHPTLTTPLGWIIAERLPRSVLDKVRLSSDPEWGQASSFPDGSTREAIADALQEVIASCIAYLIDAGSEAEAIMEDESLHDALLATIEDW